VTVVPATRIPNGGRPGRYSDESHDAHGPFRLRATWLLGLSFEAELPLRAILTDDGGSRAVARGRARRSLRRELNFDGVLPGTELASTSSMLPRDMGVRSRFRLSSRRGVDARVAR
jgi:hypothetical protein